MQPRPPHQRHERRRIGAAAPDGQQVPAPHAAQQAPSGAQHPLWRAAGRGGGGPPASAGPGGAGTTTASAAHPFRWPRSSCARATSLTGRPPWRPRTPAARSASARDASAPAAASANATARARARATAGLRRRGRAVRRLRRRGRRGVRRRRQRYWARGGGGLWQRLPRVGRDAAAAAQEARRRARARGLDRLGHRRRALGDLLAGARGAPARLSHLGRRVRRLRAAVQGGARRRLCALLVRQDARGCAVQDGGARLLPEGR